MRRRQSCRANEGDRRTVNYRSGGLAILTLSVAMACESPRPTPAWHQETGYRWRELDVPSSGTPGFTTMDPSMTGIRFENFVSDSALLGNRILGQGAGTCIGDVDGDGRPDVFLARTEGSNKLYRNLGNWPVSYTHLTLPTS